MMIKKILHLNSFSIKEVHLVYLSIIKFIQKINNAFFFQKILKNYSDKQKVMFEITMVFGVKRK